MGNFCRRFLALAALASILPDAHGLAAKSKVKKKKNVGGGKGFGASSAPSFLHTPDTSPETQTLLKFLKAQKAKGVEQGVTEIGTLDGQRGLFATTNIKKDQILCMIPSAVALALSDPSKFGEDAPTFVHGGANLLKMYCNNPQQREMWAPYLDTMPENTDSPYFTPTPDYFSDEEIGLLEFPRLIKSVKQRKEDITKLAKENDLTEEELQFATWLVSSRAFNINLSEEENTPDEDEQYDERGQVIAKAGAGLKSIRVMVPYLDMCNNDINSPNVRFTIIDPQKDDSWFALEANRNIPAGREIKMSYRSGVYSSVELLLNYGFVPEANKVDSFMLKKGGDDAITSADGWTTTLEEDESMLQMMQANDPEPETTALKKILAFRTNLKNAYKDV